MKYAMLIYDNPGSYAALSEAEQQAIFGGTASSLFDFD